MKRRQTAPKIPHATIAMDIKTAAQSAGVSHRTLRIAIAEGTLRAKRLARKILVTPADLQAWLESLDDARTTGAR